MWKKVVYAVVPVVVVASTFIYLIWDKVVHWDTSTMWVKWIVYWVASAVVVAITLIYTFHSKFRLAPTPHPHLDETTEKENTLGESVTKKN